MTHTNTVNELLDRLGTRTIPYGKRIRLTRASRLFIPRDCSLRGTSMLRPFLAGLESDLVAFLSRETPVTLCTSCQSLFEGEGVCPECRAIAEVSRNENADVILSAFSPNMLSTADGPVGVRFTRIDLDEAASLAAGAPSAVGHESTAAVFSTQLGVDVPFNRVTTTLQSGVVALVGQYRGPRLAEGATSLPEGATIEWLKVEVL